MEDHYHATYSPASGIHHGDISGLLAQAAEGTNDVDVAPSVTWGTEVSSVSSRITMRRRHTGWKKKQKKQSRHSRKPGK